MLAAFLLAVVLTVVVAIHLCRSAVRHVNAKVDQLAEGLAAWQHAHEHQATELDRRLRGITDAAVRAEAHGRALSGQLSDFGRSVTDRLDTVDRCRPASGSEAEDPR